MIDFTSREVNKFRAYGGATPSDSRPRRHCSELILIHVGRKR